jgi:hypothetical protein
LDDPDEALCPSSHERRFRQSSKESPYQAHIMGHSHVPYYKIVEKCSEQEENSIEISEDPAALFLIEPIRGKS